MRRTNKDYTEVFNWSFGGADEVVFYRGGDKVAALSANYNLDYAGIQVLDIKTGEEVDSVFIDNIIGCDIFEGIEDFFSIPERQQFELLSNYLDC